MAKLVSIRQYKVGDIVTIKKNLEPRYFGNPGITDDMCRLRGMSMEIKYITDGGWYKLVGDSGNWSWSDDMIEGFTKDYVPPPKVIQTTPSYLSAHHKKIWIELFSNDD